MKTCEFLDAVAEALGLEPGAITIEATPETIKTWDSIGHLSIIGVIDAELGLDTAEDESLQRFASMRELVDRLQAQGALGDDA